MTDTRAKGDGQSNKQLPRGSIVSAKRRPRRQTSCQLHTYLIQMSICALLVAAFPNLIGSSRDHHYHSAFLVEAYAVNESPSIPSSTSAASRSERQANLLKRARQQVSSSHAARSRAIFLEKTNVPVRPLAPPFPNGLCGGRLVTLPPSQHYEVANRQITSNSLVLPPRDITVWLPPDYDKHPDMKFPVLYCHDGQNAMQDSTSWTGYSWRLAGALTRLAERQLLTKTTDTFSPPIVVMMPCAEEKIGFVPRRHLEYGDISLPFAMAHADFVGLTLKPLIDDTFRTLVGRENTSAIGSSLGGQASLHLLLRFPELFSKVACMSPAFQPAVLALVATNDALASVKGDGDGDSDGGITSESSTGTHIYIDNGGDVDDVKVAFVDVQDHFTSDHWWNPGYWWLDNSLQPGIDAMKLALDVKGIPYTYKKFAGGRHNERGWANRIHKPLLSLYGDLE